MWDFYRFQSGNPVLEAQAQKFNLYKYRAQAASTELGRPSRPARPIALNNDGVVNAPRTAAAAAQGEVQRIFAGGNGQLRAAGHIRTTLPSSVTRSSII